ncbi:MAG: hypothetical protein FJZ00_13045 [Candidatus Sericytochromatia bacterium]|uniref:Uncharacterized protein n=1 Tax=Candidatus Tanganyikabacteria bacterium TaxID=2961651 RepID=A0A937X852_9BACT|nr:hypothetical protein [Candidatus Tanganyikabacteria bacterium]
MDEVIEQVAIFPAVVGARKPGSERQESRCVSSGGDRQGQDGLWLRLRRRAARVLGYGPGDGFRPRHAQGQPFRAQGVLDGVAEAGEQFASLGDLPALAPELGHDVAKLVRRTVEHAIDEGLQPIAHGREGQDHDGGRQRISRRFPADDAPDHEGQREIRERQDGGYQRISGGPANRGLDGEEFAAHDGVGHGRREEEPESDRDVCWRPARRRP